MLSLSVASNNIIIADMTIATSNINISVLH
jgi:hypothetical protein